MRIPHVSTSTGTAIMNYRRQYCWFPHLENPISEVPQTMPGVWVGTVGRPRRGAREKGPHVSRP